MRATLVTVVLAEAFAYTCPYDRMRHDLPYQTASQRYHSQHGRRASSSSSTIPIRIKILEGNLDGISVSTQSWLMDTLMVAAVASVQNMLQVIPVQGPLLGSRQCTAGYWTGGTNQYQCSGFTLPLCAFGDSQGESSAMDITYMAGDTECSTHSGSCTTTPDRAGVPDADFAIYVSANDVPDACSGGTLAYAKTCVRDQISRPVFGAANFCPSSLDTNANAWEDQLETAIHEILHALGYNSDSWALFRDEHGDPMTARDAYGMVPESFSRCSSGAIKEGRHPSSSTISVTFERGHWVTRLHTPRATAVARDLLGCSTITGVELENQDTNSLACYPSHVEQRSHMNEIMASTTSHESIVSVITLAILADSGWYKPNYTAAKPLVWGRSKGCGFATQPCGDGQGNFLDGWCDTDGAHGCTPDYRAKGYCNLVTYSQSLPAAFQYFSDPFLGGGLSVTDYCPYFRAFSDGDCDVGANQPSTNYRAETYASGSKCFESTLTQVIDGKRELQTTRGACHTVRCTDGVLELRLALEGGEHWLSCPTPGAVITPPSHLNLHPGSTITCPSLSTELLCEPHECQGLECHGSEDCVAGACICGQAFGTLCQIGALPPSPPRSPQLSPAAPPATYSLSLAFVVSGSVTDYDQSSKRTILDTLSAQLGLGAVAPVGSTLTVAAASVSMDAFFPLTSANQAAQAQQAAETSLSTVSALQQVLVSAGINATIEEVSAISLAAPPPGSPPSMPPLKDSGTSMVLIIASAAGGSVGLLGLGIFVWYCSRSGRRKRATSSNNDGVKV